MYEQVKDVRVNKKKCTSKQRKYMINKILKDFKQTKRENDDAYVIYKLKRF